MDRNGLLVGPAWPIPRRTALQTSGALCSLIATGQIRVQGAIVEIAANLDFLSAKPYFEPSWMLGKVFDGEVEADGNEGHKSGTQPIIGQFSFSHGKAVGARAGVHALVATAMDPPEISYWAAA